MKQIDIDISNPEVWDTEIDYTLPKNRAGKSFYLFRKGDSIIRITDDPNKPNKIGGFYCTKKPEEWLPGINPDDYEEGDILPQTVWNWAHRPVANPTGMFYWEEGDVWMDIDYLDVTMTEITPGPERQWTDYVKERDDYQWK